MIQNPSRLAICHSVFAAIVLAAPGFISAQAEPAAGKQVEMSFKADSGITVPYLLALPKDYGKDAGKKWPVILFLHGRGESNGPLSLVAQWGPPRFAARGDNFPYIVISPQCPRETNWNDPEQQEGVLAVLDLTLKSFDCDPARVYLTGLSMGGYGSWDLAAKHPKRFAAVAPVCGGGTPDNAAKLVDVPIWAFHGDKDGAVPFEKSVEMVEAIKEAGGTKILFTSMEEYGHNCWSATYATPQLYDWFNKHSAAGE